jgi:hypothetical protein
VCVPSAAADGALSGTRTAAHFKISTANATRATRAAEGGVAPTSRDTSATRPGAKILPVRARVVQQRLPSGWAAVDTTHLLVRTRREQQEQQRRQQQRQHTSCEGRKGGHRAEIRTSVVRATRFRKLSLLRTLGSLGLKRMLVV